MLDQLIGTAVVRVSLVKDILAHLVERLCYIQIQVKQLVHDLFVDDCVFVVDLLLRNEVQVVGQVLHVPDMLLNLLQ